MSWEVASVVAEVIAAIAVIISVGYLALQIRAATKQSQAQTHSTAVTDFAPFVDWQVSDKEFADVFRNGLLDFEALDSVDRIRFSHAFYYLLMALKDTFEAYERGMMDEGTYLAWENYIGAHLKMPGGLIWWSEARASWIPKIQERIDAAIARATPAHELMPIIWASTKQ